MNNVQGVNQQCCCFNLRKVTRAVTQLFDHHLEPVGVRVTQFTLLIAFANTEATTLTAVSTSLVMDRTTLTRNLRPLEQMGLIENIVQVDKRAKGYKLTDLGVATVERGLPLWQQAQQILLDEFGAEQYIALRDNLLKLQTIASNNI